MKKTIKNDKGFTLIEVFASLILITIILLSFYGLFIQSNKTSKTSSTIIDSTYLAQTEMESVFKKIKGKTEEQLASSLNYKSVGPPQTASCGNKGDIGFSTSWTFEKQQNDVRFELTIKRHCQFELLDSVIINVYKGGVLKSAMENIYSRE